MIESVGKPALSYLIFFVSEKCSNTIFINNLFTTIYLIPKLLTKDCRQI